MKINEDQCLGCGACESVCPWGIEMKHGKAYIKNPNAEKMNEAIDICPVDAIKK